MAPVVLLGLSRRDGFERSQLALVHWSEAGADILIRSISIEGFKALEVSLRYHYS